MIELLAQVEGKMRGKSFCAGIVLWDDRVVEAAPILRKVLARKTRDQVRSICAGAGWRISVVHQIERSKP